MKRFIRTCQSCNYELVLSGEPKNTTSKSFMYRKCPKCKSENFDYGSQRGYDTKPWREKWKTLTGRELTIHEIDLDKLIYDKGDEGLFEGNELYQALLELNQ